MAEELNEHDAVTCPICFKLFPTSKIANHASSCSGKERIQPLFCQSVNEDVDGAQGTDSTQMTSDMKKIIKLRIIPVTRVKGVHQYINC